MQEDERYSSEVKSFASSICIHACLELEVHLLAKPIHPSPGSIYIYICNKAIVNYSIKKVIKLVEGVSVMTSLNLRPD